MLSQPFFLPFQNFQSQRNRGLGDLRDLFSSSRLRTLSRFVHVIEGAELHRCNHGASMVYINTFGILMICILILIRPNRKPLRGTHSRINTSVLDDKVN